MFETAAQIIDAHGGNEEFGKAIGQTAAYVRVMRHRRYIPRSCRAEVMAAFPEITLDVLKAIEAAAKAAKPSEAA